MHDHILEDVKLFLLVRRQRWIVLFVLSVESQELTLLLGCQVDHSRMSSIDWNAILKQVKEFVQFFIFSPRHVLLIISFSTELFQHTKLIRRQIDQSWVHWIEGSWLHNVDLMLCLNLLIYGTRLT